ncbi:hypothetical protein GC173_11615 [bacterium]|nr:hypothetical protein [bacterium]
MRALALLFFFSLLASVVTAREPDDPLFVRVNAQTLSGQILSDVPFHLIQGEKILGEMKTGKSGHVNFTVPESTDWQVASVVLADTAWKALPPTRRLNINKTTWTYIFRLYPADPARLPKSELEDYLRALPEIAAADRAAGGPLNPAPEKVTTAHLTAFLEGSRKEQVATFEKESTPTLSVKQTAPQSLVYTTLIDAQGRPVSFRRALLFTIKEGTSEMVLIRNRNSNRQGVVGFGDLEPGRLYRIEVAPDAEGNTGRSAIFRGPQPGKGPGEALKPISLLPFESTASGIVTFAGEPLAGAEISLNGSVRLSTRSDALGCFNLSPIPKDGDTHLLVRRPGSTQTAVLPFSGGRTEYVLPLDLLIPATEK